MQVTLRVWHGQPHSHRRPCCYLWEPLGQPWAPTCLQSPWGRRQSVPPPHSPTGKRPCTLIRVHGHGSAFQIRTWLAFPTAANPSSGYHALPERTGC